MASTQDRYDTAIETRRTRDGKLVYRSLRPRSIKPNPLTDLLIPASDSTRIDKIAFNVFGSALDWWRLASVNGRVDGSLYFRPGTKIVIPANTR